MIICSKKKSDPVEQTFIGTKLYVRRFNWVIYITETIFIRTINFFRQMYCTGTNVNRKLGIEPRGKNLEIDNHWN